MFGWWLEGFTTMMLEVEKCSPLYTLNVFKKEKDNPFVMMAELMPKESKDIEEEPKQRRLWTRN